MGVNIVCVIVAVIAFLAGAGANYWASNIAFRKDLRDSGALVTTFKQVGFNFELLVDALSGMSTKAQATFAYQYVNSIKAAGNKRLLHTLERYVAMALTKETGPSKGKAL